MTEPPFELPVETQENVSLRLKRIEGQIRGIQRMVDEGRNCGEIVNQVVAVKAALSSLNAVLLTCYVRDCFDASEDADCGRDETISGLIDMMLKATR
jgi:DNA-binding FrmR family transcriptional regulator